MVGVVRVCGVRTCVSLCGVGWGEGMFGGTHATILGVL